MKLCNNIKLSVFCSEEEKEEEIAKALISLIPLNLEDEKLSIKKTTAIGFNEKKIKILEIFLEKDRHTNEFLDFLDQKLSPDQKDILIGQTSSRLDEDLNFFIRFDKAKLINNGTFWLTDSGNCFHLKLSIAAFPKKKEKALEIIRKIFKQSSQ